MLRTLGRSIPVCCRRGYQPCTWRQRWRVQGSTAHRRGFAAARGRSLIRLETANGDQKGEGEGGIGSTIYALATAPGRAAIAVVYSSLCPSRSPPPARKATLRTLYRPGSPDREVLDPGSLVLFFPAPHSHTGEDVLELHLHGGPAVIRAVLSSISALSTPTLPVHPAGPGEFTRRAFANDRLSLPQIEALGDTLSAETEQQRKLSVQAATSGLSGVYERWRKTLLSARGELEAIIDFSEDQQFDSTPAEMCANVVATVQELRSTLSKHTENAVRGELLRSGISLALVGAPNAGKSSLLNRIVGREAAIVSREAGTTRDVVDLSVDIGGYMVLLADTAGLRRAALAGEVEQEGMRRAKLRVANSQVVLVVLSIEPQNETPYLHMPAEVSQVLRGTREENKQVLVAVNKTDLLLDNSLPESIVNQITPYVPRSRIHGITCVRSSPSAEDGIQGLLFSLTEVLAQMTATGDGCFEAIGATDRQRRLVQECTECLDAFLDNIGAGEDAEVDCDVVVAAEELRFAAGCLAKITGRGEGSGDVEEVLGIVFEKFCVGK